MSISCCLFGAGYALEFGGIVDNMQCLLKVAGLVYVGNQDVVDEKSWLCFCAVLLLLGAPNRCTNYRSLRRLISVQKSWCFSYN
jgi:hypothetical protein